MALQEALDEEILSWHGPASPNLQVTVHPFVECTPSARVWTEKDLGPASFHQHVRSLGSHGVQVSEFVSRCQPRSDPGALVHHAKEFINCGRSRSPGNEALLHV